jgi:hypothetical protein
MTFHGKGNFYRSCYGGKDNNLQKLLEGKESE